MLMKKLFTLLLVLTGMVSTVSATGTETTVYYAVPSYLVNNGDYTVKVNVRFTSDQDNDWESYDMTYTNKTYMGFRVYSRTFTDWYNGLYVLQFQRWNGGSWVGDVSVFWNTWTAASTYNGKMYVHGAADGYKWITPTYDSAGDGIHITYHVQGTNSWTPSNAYIYTSTENYNNGWAGEPITANAFNDGWYDYVVYYPFNVIIFNNGDSGNGNQTGDISINTAKDEYWTTYVVNGEEGTTTTVDRDSKPEGWIDYQRTGLTAGNYGTICLPYAATITGATIYKITSTVGSGESLTGINIEEVEGNAVEAGKAYIFKATGTTLTATYSGSYTEASAGYGMMGTYTATTAPQGSYVIGSDNMIHKVTGDAVNVGQYKGYITLDGIDPAAPGLDFIPFFDSELSGINTVQASESKVNGYFNLNGQRVAQPTKGLYIVNGKKVVLK